MITSSSVILLGIPDSLRWILVHLGPVAALIALFVAFQILGEYSVRGTKRAIGKGKKMSAAETILAVASIIIIIAVLLYIYWTV